MINEKVAKLINEQINKELYSAYLYLDISNHYDDMNLDGFASWYMIQAQEERDHAMLMYQYLHNNDAKVTLEDNGEGIYTNSGTIKAESVFLNEGKEIVVSLTSASKFNMQTAGASEYKLPYTAEGAFGKLTDKEAGGIVAKFATSTTVQNTPVTFTTDETPKYAGTFTDPVVFTIEVGDIVTAPADGG